MSELVRTLQRKALDSKRYIHFEVQCKNSHRHTEWESERGRKEMENAPHNKLVHSLVYVRGRK